jgi:CHASE3 domain sensor protein
MRQIVNVSYEELVTKQEFRQEIQELRQEFKQELRQSVDEQKQYANKMAAAIIVGAPAFYAGLQFLLTFLTASKTF